MMTRDACPVAANVTLAALLALLAGGCTADEAAQAPQTPLLGLRSVIYHVDNLAVARDWYRQALGIEPYFDEEFYVGFDVGGSELGLDPDVSSVQPGAAGGIAYWRVDDIEAAVWQLIQQGATGRDPIADVGGGVRVATVTDPFGNVLGLIQEAPADER